LNIEIDKKGVGR